MSKKINRDWYFKVFNDVKFKIQKKRTDTLVSIWLIFEPHTWKLPSIE